MDNVLNTNKLVRSLNKKDYAFEMLNIHKSFHNGQIKANVGINLSVLKNEIHAIIGENGAGKSTLMSILFGLYNPDKGEIYISGKKVKFSSSKDAAKYNIGMVHQHFKLIENYSVLDNIILGSEITVAGFLNRKKAKAKITSLIKEYGFDVELNAKASTLTVGQQQKVEILKVLYRNSDILIFDEPTAILSDVEIQNFLDTLKIFKQNGKTIVIITHKLNEVKAIADVVTVIRKGEYIATFDAKDVSIEEMAELMVGRKIIEVRNDAIFKGGEVSLEVNKLDLTWIAKIDWLFSLAEKKIKNWFVQLISYKNWFFKLFSSLSFNKLAKNDSKNKKISHPKKHKEQIVNTISFNAHKGEIFGIFGIEGNGQSELVNYLSGLKKARIKNIIFDGMDISKFSIKKRIRSGISHIPEDRHKYGLVLDQNCRKNTVNDQINKKPFSNAGIIIEYEIAAYANKIIENFDVRGTANGTASARSLSGGNQQKLIIGREITKKHKLVIMAQPTRGLDVGAIEYIHDQIIKEKDQGNTIILVSYELDEILSLSDTIAVISKNKIVGVGPKNEMTRSKIGYLLTGVEI